MVDDVSTIWAERVPQYPGRAAALRSVRIGIEGRLVGTAEAGQERGHGDLGRPGSLALPALRKRARPRARAWTLFESAMQRGPAIVCGGEANFGAIAPGAPADVMLLDYAAMTADALEEIRLRTVVNAIIESAKFIKSTRTPASSPGEAIIDEHCYSAFIGADLAERLGARGIRTLAFAGAQTNVCVETSPRDACSLGFHVVAPADCVASRTAEPHEATLKNVRFLFGDVLSGRETAAFWPARA